MTDMNAFERLVAAEVQVEAGPSRPTDVAAVIRAAATKSPRWRIQSMFSATKYVFAGVVVALFGGLLMSGVLPAQRGEESAPAAIASPSASTEDEERSQATAMPETATRSDILPGVDLHTEEIEPGVFRLIDDGVRDLDIVIPQDGLEIEDGYLAASDHYALTGRIFRHGLVTGLDGSVWSLRPDGFFRLGSSDTHEIDQSDNPPAPSPYRDAEVGLDGSMWWSTGRSLYMLDPRSPGVRPIESGSRKGISIRPASDGTIWATWITGAQQLRVGRIEDGKWIRTEADELPDRRGNNYRLVAAPSGSVELWLHGLGGLHRLDGDEWQTWRQLEPAHDGNDARFWVHYPEVGPDGTLWALLATRNGSSVTLARLDDDGWQQWASDEVPFLGDHFGGEAALLEVAPDGSVWFDAHGDRDEHVFGCDGVANFNGTELRSYLRDLCVFDLEIAPDGAAWVLAGTYGGQSIVDENGGRFPSEPLPGPVRTYVIQPGAPADR